MITLLLSSLIWRVWSGAIHPDLVSPIALLRTNAGQTSRYSFTFRVSTPIPADASVTVEFPLQYNTPNLGLFPPCQAYDLKSMPQKPLTCNPSFNVITITVGQIDAGLFSFRVENVLNPKTSGATGNFIIRTWQGSTIVDENALYPPVGISDVPHPISTTLSAQGNLGASFSPLYQFKASGTIYYPPKSWIRIIFPADYYMKSVEEGGLRCYLLEIKAWIGCNRFEDSTTVHTDMIGSSLPAGTVTISVFDVKNPGYSGTTGTFLMEVMREHTYTVYSRSGAVSGVSITPGTIGNVSILGSPLYMNLQADYTIVLKTKNAIPQGGSISVTFPSTFQTLVANTCFSVSGLQGVGAIPTCSVSGNTMVFSGFTAVQSQQSMKLAVVAINPATPGLTPYFEIRTFKDAAGSVLIDQNLQAGKVTISNVQHAKGQGVDMFQIKTDVPVGSYGPLDIFFLPRNLPTRSQIGEYYQFVLTVPTQVSSSGVYSCTFGKAAISGAKCAYVHPVLTFQTPASVDPECCPLAITLTTINAGGNEGFMLNSDFAGEAIFNIKYYHNAIFLEEAEYRLRTSARPFNVNMATDFRYLHHTRDAWNVIEIDLTSNVDIPINGMLEWEFQTHAWSFPMDLGWHLTSFGTHDFPCVNSFVASGLFITGFKCTLTAGTTEKPAYVRLTGHTAIITKNVKRTFVLGNVKNAPYAYYTPYFILRSKDIRGFILEESQFTFGNQLQEIPLTTSASTATITSPNTDYPSDEYLFSFPLAYSLVAANHDGVYFVFPNGFKWQTNYNGSVSSCLAGFQTGTVADYIEFTQHQSHSIVFITKVNLAIVNPIQFCLKIDNNSLWYQTPVIQVLVVQSHKVVDIIMVTAPIVNPPNTITLTGVKPLTTAYNLNTKNLWELKFTTINRITTGGTIQVMFPTTHWASVGSTCYKIYPSTPTSITATCHGEQSFLDPVSGVTFHRIVLSKIVSGAQLNSGEQFIVQFYATTGIVTGNPQVQVFSQDEDDGTDKRIDILLQTYTLPDVLQPYNAEIDSPITSKVDARINEWGPIRLRFQTVQTYPGTTNLEKSMIRVTFPMGKFPMQVGSTYLDCRINTVIARHCEKMGSNPDLYEIYTPLTLNPGQTYELILHTRRGLPVNQNGFHFPPTAGDYKFIMDVRMNYDAGAREQGESWLHVPYTRFTDVSIKSWHKLKGEPNVYDINFVVATSIPSSNNPTTPGVIWMEFPYDPSVNGRGWLFDLGMGFPDGYQIDCDDTLTTAPKIGPTILCYLVHGYVDYVKIKITGFSACIAGNKFNLKIPGMWNPADQLYDFPIRIRSLYEDLNSYSTPNWVVLDEALDVYVDTTFNWPGNPQLGQNSPPPSSFDPVSILNDQATPNTQGASNVNIQLNIENTASVSGGDDIWVQFPRGYLVDKLPSSTVHVGSPASSCAGTPSNGYPLTRWVLFKSCTSFLKMDYTIPQNPNFVVYDKVQLPNWTPFGGVKFRAWYINEQKAYNKMDPQLWDVTKNIPPSGSCTVLELLTEGVGASGAVETYRFRFTCPTAIPAGGSFKIYFPSDYKAAYASTCKFGRSAQLYPPSKLKCAVYNGAEVQVSGFTTGYIGGDSVEILIDALNPTVLVPTVTGQFIIRSFLDDVDPVEMMKDEQLNAGTVTCDKAPAPTTIPAGGIQVGAGNIMYHDIDPLRDVAGQRTGPFRFSFTPQTKLNKKVDYIKISTAQSISIGTNAQLRCVWQHTIELLSYQCTFASGATNVITMYTPEFYDVLAAKPYTVYITTLFADNGIEGFTFNAGMGPYKLDIEEYATPATLLYKERTYVRLLPQTIPSLEVIIGHYTQMIFTRLQYKFTTPATVIPAYSAGGRIYVELETSNGMFKDDLGLGISENGVVPCQWGQLSAFSSGTLNCYIKLGVSAMSNPVKIIVTGFNQIPASQADIIIDFPKIYNPDVGADYKLVNTNLYAVDASSANPGTYLMYRTVKFIYLITQDTVPPFAGQTVSVSGNKLAPNTGDYTFAVPVANDFYVIQLPSLVSISTINPTCGVACYYYPQSNTIILTAPPVGNVVVQGITNPPYILVLASMLVFHAYSWKTFRCNGDVSYALLNEPYIGNAMTPNYGIILNRDGIFYQSDLVEYAFQVTVDSPVPSTGSITLTFSAGTLPENACYNYYPDAESDLVGPFVCTIAGLKATITGFQTVASGKNVAIRIFVANPAAGAITVTIETWYDAASTLVLQTGQITLTAVTTSTPTYFEFPRQEWEPQTVRINDYAPIAFSFIPSSTIVRVTGYIDIWLKTAFQNFPSGSDLVCLWDNVRASNCVFDNTPPSYKKVTMHAPYNRDITSKTEIVITSTNADVINVVGIQYPATAGMYPIQVNIDYTGDGTIDNVAEDVFEVWPTSDWTSIDYDFGTTSEGSTTQIHVLAKAATAIPVGGEIRIYFDVKDKWLLDIWKGDFGTGTTDNWPLYCECDGITLMPIAGESLYCVLRKGTGLNDPVHISVVNFQAVVTTGIFELWVWNLINPASFGIDDRHVHLSLLSIDSAGAYLDYRLCKDVFSITKKMSTRTPPPAPPALTAITVTPNPTNVGTSPTFKVPMPAAMGANARFMLILPPGFVITGGITCAVSIGPATCKLHPTWNGLEVSKVNSGSAPDVTLSGFANVNYVPLNTIFRLYEWGEDIDKILVTYRDNDVYGSLTTFKAATIPNASVFSPDTQTRTKAISTWELFGFTTSIAIPSGGLIQIDLQTGLKSFHNFCLPATSSVLTVQNYKCSVVTTGSATTITITNFPTIASGDITVLVPVTYPTSALTGDLVINTYADTGKTLQISTVTMTPAVTLNPLAHSLIYFPAQHMPKTVAPQNQYSEIRFKFSPTVNLGASDYIDVTAKNAFGSLSSNAVMACSINDEGTNCSIDGTLKIVTVKFPFALATGTTYEVVIYTHGGDLGVNGLQLKGNKKNPIIVDGYLGGALTFSGTKNFCTPSAMIPQLTIDYFHRTVGHANAFTITMQLANNIDGTTGNPNSIVVEFPTVNYDKKPMFADDLGTGKANNAPTYCEFLANLAGTNIKCTLLKGNSAAGLPAKVVISGFNAVTAGTSISFVLPRYNNPQTCLPDDTIIASIAVYTIDGTGVIVEYRAIDELFVVRKDQSVGTQNPTAPTFDSYVAGQSPVVLSITCQSTKSVDASTNDRYIIEMPWSYQVPASGLTVTQFSTVVTYPSANWIVMQTATTVTCSPALGFTISGLQQPTQSIAGNTSQLYGYATEDGILGDYFPYTKIIPAVAASGSATLTLAPYTNVDTANVLGTWNLQTATLKCPVSIPAAGWIDFKFVDGTTTYFAATDNRYAEASIVGQGTIKVTYDYTTFLYTVSNLSATVASNDPITLTTYAQVSASAGAQVTVSATAYNGAKTAICTASVSVNTASIPPYSVASIGKAFLRIYDSQVFGRFVASSVFDTIVITFLDPNINFANPAGVDTVSPTTGTYTLGTATWASPAVTIPLTGVTAPCTVDFTLAGQKVTTTTTSFTHAKITTKNGGVSTELVYVLTIQAALGSNTSIERSLHISCAMFTGKYSQSLDGMLIFFHTFSNNGGNYASDVGEGYTNGQRFPFKVDHPTKSGTCYFVVGNQSLNQPATALCSLASVNNQDLYSSRFKMGNAGTAYTEVIGWSTGTDSSRAYKVAELEVTTVSGLFETSPSPTCTYMASDYSIQLTPKSYTLSLNTGLLQLSKDSWVIITFDGGFYDHSGSVTPNPSTGLEKVIWMPEGPVLLAQNQNNLTGASSFSISQLTHSMYIGAVNVEAFTSFGPVGAYTSYEKYTCATSPYIGGAVTFNSVNVDPVFISLDLAFANRIPQGGCVDIVFPAAFTSLSCTYCTQTGFTDISASQSVTVAISGNTLTVSSFQALGLLANASIQSITYTASGSFTLTGTTYYFCSPLKGVIDTGTSASVTLSSATSLVYPNFLFPYSSLYTGFNEPDASQKGNISFYFTTAKTLAMSSTTPSDYFEIIYPTGSFTPAATLWCKWVDYAAKLQYVSGKCTFKSGGTDSITILTPEFTSIASGTSYYVIITSRNNVSDGITYPAAKVVTITTKTPAANTETQTVDFQVTKLFQQFLVASYNGVPSAMNLIEVTMKPSTNVALANQGEVVVEFPTYWTPQSWSLFANDLGSGLSDGDPIPCNLFIGLTLQTDSGCRIELGKGTEDFPVRLVLSIATSLSNGSVYTLGFPNIINPAAHTAHFTVYTRELITNKWQVRDLMQYQIGVWINAAYTTTTYNEPYPASLVGQTTAATNQNLNISFDIKNTIDTTGAMVFFMNQILTVDSSWGETLAWATRRDYICSNWIVVYPSASKSGSQTFSFDQVTIPDYSPVVPAVGTWAIEAYNFYGNKYPGKFIFDQGPPNPIYNVGSVTISSFSCPMCFDYYTYGYVQYTILFIPTTKITSNGAIQISFKDATNPYLKVQSECWAYSTGFDVKYGVTCSGDPVNPIWTISGFGKYTQGATIKVIGRAQQPSSASTPIASISTYKDIAATKMINYNTQTKTIITPKQLLWPGEMQAYPQRTTALRPLRIADKGPLIFYVQPLSQITKDTGQLKLSVLTATFADATVIDAFLVCKFLDTLTNNKEIKSKGCTIDTTTSPTLYTFIVNAPKFTDITTSQTWGVKITTRMYKLTGLLYPDPTPKVSSVMAYESNSGLEKATWELSPIPVALDTAWSYSYCRSTDFRNVAYVKFKANVANYSAKSRVELLFPTPMYLNDFNTGVNESGDLYCNTDILPEAASPVKCIIDLGNGSRSVRRWSSVVITQQIAFNSVKKVFVPYFANPTLLEQNAKVRIKAYTVGIKGEETIIGDEVVYHIYGTSTNANSVVHANSYMSTISSSVLQVSGVTFNVQTNIAAFQFQTTDYVIWRLPLYMGATISVAKNAGKTQNISNQWATVPDGTQWIMTYPGAATPYTATVQWDFSSVANPSKMPAADPIMEADFIINKDYAFQFVFDLTLSNYQKAALTVAHVWASDASNASYQNGYIDYEFLFSLPVNLPSTGFFKITFPAGFTLDSTCTVASVTMAPLAGGFVSCRSDPLSVLDAIVSNFNGYTSGASVRVIVWAANPTATGLVTFTVYAYNASPAPATGEVASGTTSLTINAVNAVNPLHNTYYTMAETYLPVRATDQGPVYFTVSVPAQITKKDGCIKIQFSKTPAFIPDEATPPPAPICTWSNGIVTYGAYSCTYASQVLTAFAPEYTDIPMGNWILYSSTKFKTNKEGYTFPTYGRDYGVTVSIKKDLVTDLQFGYGVMRVPGANLFSTNLVKWYNVCKNTENIFDFNFVPSVALGVGIGQATGGTSFFEATFDMNTFATDLGQAHTDNAHTDCFNVSNLPSVVCYLELTNTAANKWPTVKAMYYTPGMTTATSASLQIPWISNPTTEDIIVQVRLEAFDVVAGLGQSLIYKEFRYAWVTDPCIPATPGGTATYKAAGLKMQSSSDIDFTVPSSGTVTVAGVYSRIMWRLTEIEPPWTLAYCTAVPHTCFDGSENRVLVLKPGANVTTGSTLTVLTFPTPRYTTNQTWTGYIFLNEKMTDIITYNVKNFAVQTLPTATVTFITDANSPNPMINRNDEYIVRLRTNYYVMAGGEVRIELPAGYVANANCNILHGLKDDGMRCQKISNILVSVTGFKQYNAADPAIVLSIHATNPTTAINPTSMWMAYTYGIALDTTTGIEQATSIQNYNIVNAPPMPQTFFFPTQYQTQVPLCQTSFLEGPMTLRLTPTRAPYGYKDIMTVTLPTSPYTITQTVGSTVECTFDNGANITPASICTFVGTTITVGMTDQQTFVQNTPYRIDIYTRDATAGPMRNGLNWLQAATKYGRLSFYVQFFRGGVVREAAKIDVDICPHEFTTLSFTPFHKDTKKWNIFDLSFNPTNDIPATGGVAIAFPTNNELDYTFSLDMGQGMYPLVMSQSVDCMVQQGFAGAGPGQIKCTLFKSLISSPQTPAVVEIGNLPGVIAAGTTNNIRLVKLLNPLMDVSSYISEPMTVDFNIWTFDFQFYADRYTLNNQTLLRVIDYNQLKVPAFTLITEPIVPACAITDTYTVISTPLTITTTLGVTVRSAIDAIIYEYDSAFDLPTTGQPIACTFFGQDSCQVYKLASWIVYFATGSTVTGARTLSTTDVMVGSPSLIYKTPVNMVPAGYVFSTYVIVNPRWVEEHVYTNMVTRTASNSLGVTLTHILSSLNLRTYDVWTITITPTKGAARLVRVDIIFPSEFMWTDPSCKLISGVTQSASNTDPISCASDCASEVCTNRLMLTNFKDPSPYMGPIVIETGAKNPQVSGITSNFQVYYYSSLTDTTAIIEKRTNTLAQTITTVTYPYDYWLEWPTVSIYKRLIPPGVFGVVYFYFTSRITVPSATGWYKIIFPQEFDIAPGSTPLCTVYHTDNPFDNFPIRWGNSWMHPIMETCTWTEGEVVLQFDPDRLRVFYGTKPDICTYLVLYTTGATNNVNGIQAPTAEGCYEIEIYAMDGPVLLEAGYPQLCTSAPPMPLATLDLSNLDAGSEAILSLTFTTTRDFAKSYYYLDGNFPGRRTVLTVQFETHYSFSQNPLPAGVSTPDCYSIAGIVPKAGEKLTCSLTQGVYSYSATTTLIHDPAIITVTNFEKLLSGTFVEVHFPRIVNPGTAGYVPTIRVGMYSVDYLGNQVWLYSLNSLSIAAVSVPAPVASVAGTLTPSSLGVLDRVSLKFSFQATTGNLVAGDMMVFTFPSMFASIPASGVSASIIKNAYTNPSTDTYVLHPRVVTYPSTLMLAITLLAGQTVTSTELLDVTLYSFTNPSYVETACPSGCAISYYSIRSKKVKNQRATANLIAPTLTLTSAGLGSMRVLSGTLFAGDVFNSYVFLMQTLVELTSGTVTTVTMPAAFPDINTASPPVGCWSNFTGTCTMATQSFVLAGYPTIPRGTILSATLSGLKNPTTSGYTPVFPISTKDSAGRSVMDAKFPPVYINPQKPVNKCFLQIDREFPNAGLRSDYNFTITPVAPLPKGSKVVITFPSEYPTIPVTSRCNVFLPLDSYQSCTIKSPSVTLITNNDLASADTFTVSLTNVINPTIKTADANGGMATSLFSITTSYDGVTLDINDPNSSQSALYIEKAPTAFPVTSFIASPNTEAEYARYSFEFNSPVAITSGDGSSLLVKFPLEYRTQLVEDGFDLYCLSRNKFAGCRNVPTKKVEFFETKANVAVGEQFGVDIYGVVNPVAGITSDFAIYLYDTRSRKVLAANEQAGQAKIMPLPFILNMTSVYSGLNLTHVSTEHNLTFSIESVGVSPVGRLWLDWPGDYYKLFLTPPYKCSFYQGPLLVTGSQPICTWLIETALKRSEMTGYPAIPENSGLISFIVKDVPTLQKAGLTGHFIIRFFDLDKNSVTLRSYPDLTPYSNLQFFDQGYKVYVKPSKTVTVYRGLFSSQVTFKLQHPSFIQLKFTPYIPSGGFTIVPDSILFQYVWGDSVAFRVRAPIVTAAGSYVVNWVSYEDQVTRKYQPISDLSVVVLDPANAVPVTCSEISPTMVSGTSQPILVTLSLPTVDGVTVKLSTTSPQQDAFVVITPTTLVYTEGESQHSFTITLIQGVVSGFIQLELGGMTAAAYYLPKDKVQFLSMPTSNRPPKIVDTRIHRLGRTSAAIRVLCSQIALVHHVLAYRGTDPPIIPLFVHGVLGKSHLPQRYNVTSTNYYNFVADLELERLTDDTEYVVYIALTSQTGVFGMQLESVSFRTMPPYRAARVRLFTSSIVSSKVVLSGLAATLAIPESHFTLTALDPFLGNEQKKRRMDVNPYQKDVYFEFQLVVGHNESYNSPVSYLNSLLTKTDELKANIPYYSVHDLSQTLAEIESTYPEIDGEPEVVTGPGWAAVTVKTTVGGKVHGVVLRKGMRPPTAFQVQNGLDGHCWWMDSGRNNSASVARGQSATLNFTGLHESIVYEIYLAAENDAPLPQLMETYSIRSIEIHSGADVVDKSVVFKYLNGAVGSAGLAWGAVLLSLILAY